MLSGGAGINGQKRNLHMQVCVQIVRGGIQHDICVRPQIVRPNVLKLTTCTGKSLTAQGSLLPGAKFF